MNPSTKNPVADRAVLCQRGSELAEFEPLLSELGISVEVHTGELPGPDVLAGASLAIVAGQRLAEGKPVSLRSWPRTLAVVDDGSKTLAAHLNRIGVAMVIRRPIHPRALRLLLLHELYRGPERRAKKRILIGHPIRVGVGLFKQNATLLELSRTGARVALASPPKIGTLIHFVLGKELTNSKPIKIQAKVVRAIRPGSGESEVGVAMLNAVEHAKPIQSILDRFALGPAMTGPSVRNPASSAAPRGLPVQAAPRPGPIPAQATTPTASASTSTPKTARPPAPPAPPAAESRRLPPSYQPAPTASTSASIPAAPPAAPAASGLSPSPASDPAPVIEVPARSAVPKELEGFAADCELEVDEDGSDFVLELDDEAEDATASESNGGADRRRSARVPYPQRIVALDEQAARVVVGRDLCLGGMRIAANPELAVGDVLRLALHAGSEMEPLVVLAGVERDDGEDGLVLAFASLTGPQRERLAKILAASGAIQTPADDDENETESLVVGELLGRVSRGQPSDPPRAGFTLVELMIVVAIIGVMTSVAIPLFGRYQHRARSAEAVSNLSAIRVVQESHFAEHGLYLPASAEPALIPGPNPVPFDIAGTGYALMGWSPDGRVFFSYAVATSADATGYTADAAADIDGDGILQIWGYAKPDPFGALTMGGLGCDPALLTPEVAGRCSVGSSAF